MHHLWNIWHSQWVITDGNYDHFRSGQIAHFALEFHATDVKRIKSRPGTNCQQRGDGYLVEAEISALYSDAWTIDFGIAAYQNQPPPKRTTAGDQIKASIELSVDPYPYFEYLSRREGIPALIYEWRIERITMVSSPVVLGYRPRIGRCWVPNNDQERRQDIDSTAAPPPPGFHYIREGNFLRATHSIAFMLQCARLNVPPTRFLSEPT